MIWLAAEAFSKICITIKSSPHKQCRLMMGGAGGSKLQRGMPETTKGRLRANLFRAMLAAVAQNDG